MTSVYSLRENDPSCTQIILKLHHENSVWDVARALEQNPFITEITVDLSNERRIGWNFLLSVIEARDNLVKVRLMDAIHVHQAPAALVSAILRAIQQNAAVRSVQLTSLRLPTNLCSFVDTASSITSFSLCSCDMEPVEREQGIRDLAAALQRTTNINTLEIGILDDIYAIPVLQGLRSNISLKKLFISSVGNFSTATAQAIQQLFESTTSIQTTDLASSFKGEEFCLVAQGIISSRSLSELKLSHCQFMDEQSAALFRDILQNKRNLTSLCLDNCKFTGGDVHATVISSLSRPDSPLRSFELMERSLGDALPNSQFRNLLRAVQKSKLERFSIGTIQSQEQLRTLTESIPKMRIKELQVVISNAVDQEDTKPLLLLAIKNNFSLQSVDGKRASGRDLFNANDTRRLVFYANRNELLGQWVDNPKTVERKVWPEALKLAEQAGPDSLFRGLRSLLESDNVTLRAGRKRKRSQFYVPS